MVERPEAGLKFRVEGLRVSTRGLVAHDHPELTLEVSASGELGAARALLVSLAADVVVRGARFVAGEEIPYGGEVLRLAPRTMELWERDPLSGSFHRGAPRLLATLQEGP
jgi:hypothetical protein